MSATIVVSSLSARRLVNKLNQYAARGYDIDAVWYEPRLLLFARYYGILKSPSGDTDDSEIEFVIGPVSEK